MDEDRFGQMEQKVRGFIAFPCCPKETVIVYEIERGSFSCKCPRCGKFVLFNTTTMTSEMCPPLKGVKAKFRRIKTGDYFAGHTNCGYSETTENNMALEKTMKVVEREALYIP